MEYLITTELSRALRVQLQEINHATHGNYPGPQSSSSSDHPENTNPPKESGEDRTLLPTSCARI
jgi:hypothetical protein